MLTDVFLSVSILFYFNMLCNSKLTTWVSYLFEVWYISSKTASKWRIVEFLQDFDHHAWQKWQGSVEPIKYFSLLILSSRHDFFCNYLYQIYVSSVQAYRYPVTAIQWHPEVHWQLNSEYKYLEILLCSCAYVPTTWLFLFRKMFLNGDFQWFHTLRMQFLYLNLLATILLGKLWKVYFFPSFQKLAVPSMSTSLFFFK